MKKNAPEKKKKAPGRENGGEILVLKGDWTIGHVVDLEKEFSGHPRREKATIDPSHIKSLDTAGAWLIRMLFPHARFAAEFSERQQALFDFAGSMPAEKRQGGGKKGFGDFFAGLGKKSVETTGFIHDFFFFIGVISQRLARNFLQPRHFRLPSITRHVQETGFNALPLIGLLAFGISTVIFYQGGTQLGKFGADIYTIDLTVISLLREMAVLTTAIMVAGRSGSAFAAEIGVMKMRGEVDALQTMGIDPVEALVVPRLLALFITLPLLVFFCCFCRPCRRRGHVCPYARGGMDAIY